MKVKIVILIFLCIVIFSCAESGEKPIPTTHIPTFALWTQKIDRRINYISNKSEILEEDLMIIKNEIHCSVNAICKKAPSATIYEYFYNPFNFQIIINDLNTKINKILLNKCFVITKDNELKNILEILFENISCEFSWISNDGHRSWFPDRNKINEHMEIFIEKRQDEHINGIYLNFHDIPINYDYDEILSIAYELIICSDDQIKTIEHEIIYNRKIEELKMYHFIRNPIPIRGWREISIEEWNKYL